MDVLLNEMLDIVKEFPPFVKVFYTKKNRGGLVRGYFCAGTTVSDPTLKDWACSIHQPRL